MGRQEKQDLIFDTALKVFARYGFKRTRVEDIASELGMTKGNLYLYAKDKKDLYEKAVSRGLLRWQGRVRESISGIDDVEEQFLVMCRKSFMYLSRDVALRTILINDPAIFPLSQQEDRFAEINRASMDLLRSVLKRGIEQKRFREVDVTYVTELLFSIYVMFIIRTYIKAEVKSAGKMFEQAVDLILGGLLRRD
ncbi:MAG TPA: TetR/AcrR family transcriptional regulator [Deltaproteobacteria bacterium]|nr:TetR/AcrR family transcriptional regulator [Deltaproteobacteria bacterium]HPR55378.1 TetR/AcrR family transcriptional regulator [Deltaproteobacteria bacterium]HXK48260.1 TetR/AcrR family transcriptional regulator [Deltaproteobacteria bacterium]